MFRRQCIILAKQIFLDCYICFSGTCSLNQECVATAKCPFIEKLNTLINISTNEDEKNALNEVINSRKCGGPSEETVCCEIPQGKCLYLVVFD